MDKHITISDAIANVLERAHMAAERNIDYLTLNDIMHAFNRPDLGSDKVVIFFDKEKLGRLYPIDGYVGYIQNDIKAVEEVYNG